MVSLGFIYGFFRAFRVHMGSFRASLGFHLGHRSTTREAGKTEKQKSKEAEKQRSRKSKKQRSRKRREAGKQGKQKQKSREAEKQRSRKGRKSREAM
jgi:hypothetical protein